MILLGRGLVVFLRWFLLRKSRLRRRTRSLLKVRIRRCWNHLEELRECCVILRVLRKRVALLVTWTRWWAPRCMVRSSGRRLVRRLRRMCARPPLTNWLLVRCWWNARLLANRLCVLVVTVWLLLLNMTRTLRANLLIWLLRLTRGGLLLKVVLRILRIMRKRLELIPVEEKTDDGREYAGD